MTFSPGPAPPLEPRQPYNSMARMMDTLILDPFVPMSKIKVNSAEGRSNNNNRPIGPVRPRPSITNRNARTPFNNNNSGEGDCPSNPNTAGGRGDWRSEAQRCEDTWKASLRRRDPDIQPTLPNIPARSRSNSHSNAPPGSSGSDNSESGLAPSHKSKSVERIPRIYEATKSSTARARATWRVPGNRRASDIRTKTEMAKKERTKSDGEVDVRNVSKCVIIEGGN